LIRSVRVSLTIAHTSPLADKLVFDYSKKNDDMNDLYWLADQDPETLTDERLETWLRGDAETIYHPVGTARMAKSAAGGVVDTELRVFGVKGLRVADASVFPNQIAAHTTATVIALGERASDLIIHGKPII
jgi:choline dehydrogenase